MNEFAKVLKELRLEKELSQKELAEKLNYKTSTVITNWESGRGCQTL